MLLVKNTEVGRHDDTNNAAAQLFILNASKGVSNRQLDCSRRVHLCTSLLKEI